MRKWTLSVRAWVPAAIAAVVVFVLLTWRPSAPHPASWDEAFEAVALERRGAIHDIERLGRKGIAPEAAARLQDERWQVRVGAIRALAASNDAAAIPMIVARASDADWHVRIGAFEALDRLGRTRLVPPQRDERAESREPRLLAWLDGQGLRGDVCELYAGAEQVLYGEALAADCLVCHVGDRQEPPAAVARCATCHATIHEQWWSSAHAQSLSHVDVATLDERQQSVWMDFGKLAGITCTQCHAQGEGGPCEGGALRSSSASCAACHQVTSDQWSSWARMAPLIVEDWPVRRTRRGVHEEPVRDCVSCHMADEEGVMSHGFAARRDVELLASSVHLSVELERTDSGVKAIAVLANLAGHATPAGTSRRALEIRAWGEDEADFIARLVPVRPGLRDPGWSEALSPGEVRRFELGVMGETVHVAVVYVRDARNPDWYQVEIARESIRLPRASADGG